MIDKSFIQRYLKTNGISVSSTDEEIRKTLKRGGWSDEEITVSLRVLRDAKSGPTAPVFEGAESLFRPDMVWSSEKLSALMGVDVVIDPAERAVGQTAKERLGSAGMSAVGGLALAVGVIFLALGIGLAFMYQMELGPFYGSGA